jgi:hypothetical protein
MNALDFTSASEMIENYARVRSAFWGKPAAKAPAPLKTIARAIHPRPTPRDWLIIGDLDLPAGTEIRVLSKPRKPNQRAMKNSDPRWHDIAREVCDKYVVSLLMLQSNSRSTKLILPRHEMAYRLRKETQMSCAAIGRKLGGRDHTTIMHSVKKHAERLKAARDPGAAAGEAATPVPLGGLAGHPHGNRQGGLQAQAHDASGAPAMPSTQSS